MATHTEHEIASAPDREAQREAFLVAITREGMAPLAAAALLHVRPSTAYRWRKDAPTTEDAPDSGQDAAPVKLTARRARRMRLLPRILQVFRGSKSKETAGADKVHSILRKDPEIEKEFGPIGHNLVADIMRKHDLRGVRSTKKVIKQPDYAPNIPRGEFRKPGRKVIGADTTQIQCADGWLYNGIQLDHDDYEIVGAAISEKNDTKMTRKSLREAARTLETKLDDPTVEKIAHSDRGPQYCSAPYKQEIEDQGFEPSNSKTHCPTDNPRVEGWFALMKREFFRIVSVVTGKAVSALPRRTVAKHLRGYIRWYNEDRPHASLGYRSPHEFAKLPRDEQEVILARAQARRDRRRKRRHEAIQRAREAKLAPIVVALAIHARPIASEPLAMAA